MKRFKRIPIVIALSLILAVSSSSTAFATTTNVNVTTNPSYTVTGISTNGLSVPTSTWSLNTDGTYSFSGSASNSTLYTNYLFYFTGNHGVLVSCTNNSSSTLTVKWKKKGSVFGSVDSMTIEPGESGTMYNCESLSANAYYYLSFSAPSDFSGSIYLN